MADFNFNLNVVTGGSAPAVTAVSKGLEATEKHAKHAAESVKLFEVEAGNLSSTVGGLTLNLNALGGEGHFFVFDLAEGFRAAYEIAEKLAEKVVEFGKEIVHSAAETEDLGVAIKFAAGEEQAKEIERLSEAFASVTRYKKSAYEQAWLPLINAGIKDTEQLGILTSVAGDIATQMHTGEAGLKESLGALGKIALGGRIKEAALKQFNIHPTEFYGEIAKSIHVTQAEAQKMLKAGSVGADKILSTIIEITKAHNGSDGKGVGAALLASSNTLGGTIERLKNLPESIFERLAGSEGMNALQGTLNNIIIALEGSAPRAVAVLNAAFTQLFGDVSGPDGAEKVKVKFGEWMTEIERDVPIIVGATKSVFGVIMQVADAIQFVTDKWAIFSTVAKIGASAALGPTALASTLGSMAVDEIAQHSPSVDEIGKITAGAAQKINQGIVVHNKVDIHVSDAQGDAHERIGAAMEQHAREQAVRLGQELSSHQ